MKKILFVSDIGISWGGSEELWSKTAKRLVSSNYEIYASVNKFEKENERIKDLRSSGIKVEYRNKNLRRFLSKSKDHFNLSFFKNYKSNFEFQISRIKPDFIVFSQSHVFGLIKEMNFANKMDIPYVSLTQLNSELSWPNDENYKVYRNAFINAKLNFFVSRGNLNMLENMLAMRIPNSSVINNPTKFDQLPTLDWPASKKVKFAFVGRIDFLHKGIDILIQSFNTSKWKERDFELNIYGTGDVELAKELVAMHKIPNVTFHGYMNSIEEIWRKNQVLLLPSRYEGMPLSMIEAMYSSRVVVTTNVAGHAELIEDNLNGYIAEAPHPTLFANKIEDVWENRNNLEKMGKLAKEDVVRKFGNDPIESFLSQLTNIIIS